MKADLVDISECKKNLDIEIPQDVVDQEITSIAREYSRQVRVPGFRPGRAPLGIIKTRYREEILGKAFQNLIPKYFTEAARERKLALADEPRFENIDYSTGQPLRFKAAFEVYPQIDITNYSDIPIEEVAAGVEDSDVDTAIGRLREDFAELRPVEPEREIRQGDLVEISFRGRVLDADEPPIVSEKSMCEIGGRTTLEEFTHNLLGARMGDTRTFRVSYGPDHAEGRLAGKTVEYAVTAGDLKEKVVPELDDEFARGLGDYAGADDLRVQLRENIEKHKKEEAEERVNQQLVGWLEANNSFGIPEALVEQQLEGRLRRLAHDIERQGLDPKRLKVDWGKIRADQRQQSIRDVKGSLILQHIREKEAIRVTEQEIDQEVAMIANRADRPIEEVRASLDRDQGSIERLKVQIGNRKTLGLLRQRARVQPSLQSSP